MIGLDSQFRGKTLEYLNLGPLWITKEYRRLGIGSQLVEMVEEKAKEMGAKKLYISGSSSKNTIQFYLSIGCKLAAEIDPELFAKEPCDIHLELKL